MSRIKEDEVREDRIIMEIVVDAYNEEERSLGWYYYLEEKLRFPFKAKCIATKKTSPLLIGEEVKVTKMAPETECEHDMFVMISWQERSLAKLSLSFVEVERTQLHYLRQRPPFRQGISAARQQRVLGFPCSPSHA